MTANTTTLIFPAGMPRALEFLDNCQRERRKAVGASSLAFDPSRLLYPDWTTLPYINQDDFADKLKQAIQDCGIGSIYSPHPVVWDYLDKNLATIAPGVALLNSSPVDAELQSYRVAAARAKALLTAPMELSGVGAVKPNMSELQLSALYLHSERIPGMCDHDKIRALYEVSRCCPEGDIVEIGSWWGKSAFIFSRLAQHFQVGKMLCVDPWSDEHLVQHDKKSMVDAASAQFSAAEALAVFQMNLLPYAGGQVNYLRLPSVAAAENYRSTTVLDSAEFGTTTYTGKIAMLHVDGNHSYENAKADVDVWAPLVTQGGWIVIDDYRWPFGDGPRRAGDEYLFDNQTCISTAFVMGSALFIQLTP